MGTAVTPSRVPWVNSLIFRVIALCIVLVLCLLGLVYFLTIHYVRMVDQEIERSTVDMVQQAKVAFEEHPDYLDDPARAGDELGDRFGAHEFDIDELEGEAPEYQWSFTMSEGAYMIVAQRTFTIKDKAYLFEVRYAMQPVSEIRRVFRNQYLLLLTLAFVAALAIMVYMITKSLRPLRQLSKSCARISEGHLEPVQVRKNSSEILALEQTFNHMVESLRDKEVVERNLRQAQRLSALGNLAAGVAHDVRNPLNAIKLLSGHAQDLMDRDPAEAGKRLETIRDEVNRLEEIVSGFLSLAKEREIQPELIPLDPMLEECVRLVKEDARARNVTLSADLRAGGTELMIDSKQMTRAVLNVLLNALEATPEGGRVRLFSRIIDRDCQIEVRDDGPGLSQEDIDRVFDPYFTTKPTGTGLGLSITRGIVEEHGGTVELTSQTGHGTQALITLPLPEL